MADDVLVNLRVLSRLQENDRLNCTGTFFAIETGVLTKVWRWLRQETREKTLSRIADVMDRASRVPHAHAFAEQAREGLERLKTTYAACPTTVARLDHIMVTSAAACSACAGEPADRPRRGARSSLTTSTAQTQTDSCSPAPADERSF